MANLGYIQLVRICNQKCRFCSNPETDYRLSPDQAKARVDDFLSRGYDGIILTGGEPTLYPDLIEIIRHTAARGIHVRMITNGQKIADRSFLEELVAAGLSHVHVSVHTDDEKLQAMLTENEQSLANIRKAFDNLRDLSVTADPNIAIQAYNASHLDRIVRWLVAEWPFVRHVVFNFLDPSSNRVAEHKECIPRLADIEVSLLAALRFLHQSGRTFRVERVPLCYMTEFAWASTETRKIVKGEERIVHFLDERGMIRQTQWNHGKAAVCACCSLESICAGLFEMDRFYSSSELYPVFVPKEPIVRKILSEKE
jgi:MoaA/NifB/PqqE/SkfB family radical SAM enzyme